MTRVLISLEDEVINILYKRNNLVLSWVVESRVQSRKLKVEAVTAPWGEVAIRGE